MDFSNRGGRPAQTQPNQQPENTQPANNPAPTGVSKAKGMALGKSGSILILVSLAVIAFALILGFVFTGGEPNKESDLIQPDKYQAVFLDSQDGQVYFGKLGVYSNETFILTDIYYVRVETPIQPQGTDTQQPNISLAKLGNELHGPQDAMFINRDRVLYWENLKDEGQVVTAIKNFQENGETAQPSTQGTQPAGTPQQNDTPAETPATPAEETTTP